MLQVCPLSLHFFESSFQFFSILVGSIFFVFIIEPVTRTIPTTIFTAGTIDTRSAIGSKKEKYKKRLPFSYPHVVDFSFFYLPTTDLSKKTKSIF